MKYDFTTKVDRRGQGASKWLKMKNLKPDVTPGVVPFSVADMELKNAPEILAGIKAYLDECILGYTIANQSFHEAVTSWMKRRHNWDVDPQWIVNTPGIVAALFTAVRAYTQPGDGVIIFKPVYYPFMNAIKGNKAVEVNVPMIEKDLYYTIDYEGFEKAAADPNNKMLIFCSPHNPVGRVWTEEELKKVGAIAKKHNLIVVADEIWHDLIMPGYKHTVFLNACPDMADLSVICTAPSKTFNLAGMGTSNIMIPNPELRKQYQDAWQSARGGSVGPLGYKACETAYNQCEGWLEELLLLLDHNQKEVKKYFNENFPKLSCPLIEGTYLQWIDFRPLGMTDEELEDMNVNKAEIFTDEGYLFGTEGSGFERINLAAPTEVLMEGMHRWGEVIKKVYKD